MTIGEVIEAGVSSGAAPGAVALAVAADGRVLYEGAEGCPRPDRRRHDDQRHRVPDLLYDQAAASTAAALLVEDGKLSLDTPVAEILPEFADVKVLDGWDGAEPVFRDPPQPARSAISPRTHRVSSTSSGRPIRPS